MFAQLFAIALLAVSAQSVVAAGCLRSYTIQEGDICDSISQAHNVSTYQLAALNSDKVGSGCSDLIPGTTLCLGENAAEDCSTTYVVHPDDTCSDVASKTGLNTTILYLNNPQIDGGCTNIYGGEVLCIAKTVMVPPIPAGGVVVPAPAASSSTLVPTTTVAASTTPAPAAVAAPAITSAPAAASTDSGDDTSNNNDDDDDLPFCDEL